MPEPATEVAWIPSPTEGTHWCRDVPEAVAALQSAYALP